MPFPPKSELTSCLTSFLSSPSPLSPSSTSLSKLFLKVCETAIESDSNVNKGFTLLKDMLGEWKEEKEDLPPFTIYNTSTPHSLSLNLLSDALW
eukprot:CAMPEP_0182517334 /NCGR_PEP_ID=MMETSP1321-20130603/42065_1 /TAXON_ID=91990 /ORGANISM="Bolidomonas sp., Strain RCC1657" /LENGTH=93 /DNA_ID=CAMNT_0024725067 /DNA_START=29 /DNA_END=307 /DNA_ORIENTATION=+